MVTIPQSVNASVDVIRGYFNAYLMHKINVEYLAVNLNALDLYEREWVEASRARDVHKSFIKLLDHLKDSVQKLAQLVSY